MSPQLIETICSAFVAKTDRAVSAIRVTVRPIDEAFRISRRPPRQPRREIPEVVVLEARLFVTLLAGRRFSTTPDPAHAQAYADEGGGDVYMFDVPTRLLRSLEPTGGVQKRIDVHLRSGSEAVEYRFSRSTAG